MPLAAPVTTQTDPVSASQSRSGMFVIAVVSFIVTVRTGRRHCATTIGS
jgi:hypothetical protein